MTNSILKKIVGVATLAILISAPVSVFAADALTRPLHTGVSGADVGTLQTYMATDSTMYPQGIVSNYFGTLTKKAVAIFQGRNGLTADGYIGSASLPIFNAAIAGTSTNSTDVDRTIISNVSLAVARNSVVVNWNTNESTKGVVYYSTSPLSLGSDDYVQISGNTAMTDTNLRTSQAVSVQNLQTNTTYYYTVVSTDQAGNLALTWPEAFTTTN